MYFLLPIIIGLELLVAALIVNPSNTLKQALQSNILGIQIAQNGSSDTTPAPDSNSQPLPADTPSDTPAPTPDTSVNSQTTPVDQQLQTTPLETPSTIVETPTPEPTPTPIDTNNPSDTGAVINPDSVINSTENVSQETINKVTDEEATIEKTTDPLQQSQTLIGITNDNVLGISKKIDDSDWSNVNFTLQRLNDTLTRASSNSKLTDQQKAVINGRLSTLCNATDPILRASSLVVPEDLQQDVEINQAKCLEIRQ